MDSNSFIEVHDEFIYKFYIFCKNSKKLKEKTLEIIIKGIFYFSKNTLNDVKFKHWVF